MKSHNLAKQIAKVFVEKRLHEPHIISHTRAVAINGITIKDSYVAVSLTLEYNALSLQRINVNIPHFPNHHNALKNVGIDIAYNWSYIDENHLYLDSIFLYELMVYSFALNKITRNQTFGRKEI